MSDSNQAEFITRFFALFNSNSADIISPEATIQSQKGEIVTPCMVEEQPDKNIIAGLTLLDPQVRKFFTEPNSGGAKYYRLAKPLSDELRRTVWETKLPNWISDKNYNFVEQKGEKNFFQFRISDISAFHFPSGVMISYLTVEPAFKFNNQNAADVGKMMVNTLCRTGLIMGGSKSKSAAINRVFGDPRQQKSIVKRIGSNSDIHIIAGLCGETISIGDIFKSLVGPDFMSMLGDRFLTNSFLKTEWNDNDVAFDKNEYIDLVRLARGESDHYFPVAEKCCPGHNGIIQTFENVAFSIAGEGIICWIKPKTDQQFLNNQFRQRYDSIYLSLYLLALNQKYALVHLAQQLEEAAPSLSVIALCQEQSNENRDPACQHPENVEQMAMRLRIIRTKVAIFYMRAFFQQPAILTNHQEFYSQLQEVIGVHPLLSEVKQATLELDHLLSNLHIEKMEDKDREANKYQHKQDQNLLTKIEKVLSAQEKASHNELVLTLVVEGVAIPYYLYSFMAHALHIPGIISAPVSVAVAVKVVWYTIDKFRKH